MNKEALNKLNDGRNLVHFVSGSLQTLADAFEDTGNEAMSKKLRNYTRSLDHACDLIDKGTSDAPELVSALEEIVAAVHPSMGGAQGAIRKRAVTALQKARKP